MEKHQGTVACRLVLGAGLLLASLGAQAFDTRFNYTDYGCVPRAQRELFTAFEPTTFRRDVSWYGDSRTTNNCRYWAPGATSFEYSTHRYTLPALATPSGLSYAQRGRDGTSLAQLELGTDAVNIDAQWNDGQQNLPWATQMQRDLSPIVVIAHGTNDAWMNRQGRVINGKAETVATFEERLERMVATAQAAGKKVLLVQPPRVCSYAMVGAWQYKTTLADGRTILEHPDTLLAPYAAAVTRVGLKTGTHVAPLFSVPVRCNGDYAKADLPDGLHATAVYNATLAAAVKTALQRVIDNQTLSTVKPTLTLLRAPLQQLTTAQMTPPSGTPDTTSFPNIMPAAGQDYQILERGTGLNGLPIMQLSNWIAAHASSVSVSCVVEAPFADDKKFAWSNLGAVNVGPPGNMPAYVGIANCVWTATGPGGTTTVPETYGVPAERTVGMGDWGQTVSQLPRLVIARGPMPLVAGQPFQTTWRAENTVELKRRCTAAGTGFNSPMEILPVSSDPNYLSAAKTWNFANLNGVVTARAEAAWVGNPTTCEWYATNAAGSISAYRETFHTVNP